MVAMRFMVYLEVDGLAKGDISGGAGHILMGRAPLLTPDVSANAQAREWLPRHTQPNCVLEGAGFSWYSCLSKAILSFSIALRLAFTSTSYIRAAFRPNTLALISGVSFL